MFHSMKESEIIEPFLVKLKARIENDPEISAAGLSVKAGLSNAAIRHWLNMDNKGPTITSARKVCKALGTTLEEFLSDAETEEEREIVRLVSQLNADELRVLIGFGKGLVVGQGRDSSKEPE